MGHHSHLKDCFVSRMRLDKIDILEAEKQYLNGVNLRKKIFVYHNEHQKKDGETMTLCLRALNLGVELYSMPPSVPVSTVKIR
ncbi:MAG: hypothetical protein COY58_01930 [Gammaproteobacteria bacterium CG_4_10_14_0_8_um_filter_38_16]|nr:MAG: hypothetical protein COY58_01930 [Gammaproteobacteria bacterium CG_4_10_14_0_8_um_filter_38_16]PJA04074.1 MAG: hypothetical protein COX72_01715 [Gammaproteobacteria bacterium CG_4_10_14_0_2_um_filter_38_22]PJB10442.1 MAG: hypothetical protein CO120_04825 [Gammaproteobacteria bacterium CG_4_9_14_3_um_filter_38_9]